MQEDESGQEKTEQPTQKRLEKAKEEGHFLRSQEFTIAFLVLGCIFLLILLGENLVESLLEVYRLNLDLRQRAEPAVFQNQMVASLKVVLGDVLLFLVSSMALAIIANVVVGGLRFNLKLISPKPGRLNPFSGLKRMFGRQGIYELLKSILKTLLILGATVVVFWMNQEELFALALLPRPVAFSASWELLSTGALLVSLTLVLIAGIDLPVKISEFREKLMMTRQEVREEFKESEGSPEVRRRIRERQREIALNKMMKAIEKADVVVVNPEHFAVALAYSPGAAGAPTVLAKGADHIALQIRTRANDLQIPLFEAPALARALYFTTRINDEIPEGLYHAVAEVIAYVFNVTAMVRFGRMPSPPTPVVPESMMFDGDGKLQNQRSTNEGP